MVYIDREQMVYIDFSGGKKMNEIINDLIRKKNMYLLGIDLFSKIKRTTKRRKPGSHII